MFKDNRNSYSTSNKLTPEKVRQILAYNNKTGVFRWRKAPRRGIRAGSIAGHTNKRGYVEIRIDKTLYLAHRLAWLYVTGGWPKGEIDHINASKGDNRFSNLRDATRSVNQQNMKRAQKNNHVGLLGVSPKRKKWRARITVDSREVNLGVYDSPEEAHNAYIKAKRKLHKEGCEI
jgi:hypothetical protein